MMESLAHNGLRAGATLLALWLSACASDHSALMPPAASLPVEAPRTAADRAAEQDHARLVAAFGGELRSPALQGVLGEVTDRLVKATARPAETYQITVLNSPVVNAFALPTGRLYVTRGLLALANDTAEVAAVLAHEIAHVTLRHANARTELEARSVLVSRVVSDILNDPVGSALMRDRSRITIASFSRAQELEADEIGAATVARAGFDPYGSVRFLTALGRWSALRADADGSPSSPDMLATHPSTPERLALALKAARRIGAPGLGDGDRARYLSALAGLTFGDNPADGIVRGRRFIHARLGVTFEAPEGIGLDNTPKAVIGVSADGGRRLLFDAIETPEGQNLEAFLRSTWSDAMETGAVETLTVNGAPAVAAVSRGQDWTFRLAAIRMGTTTYRLILAARGADIEPAFRRALDSVRQVTPEEARDVRPLHLDLATAADGDAVERFTARMAVSDRPEERFLVLNGLEAGARLKAGERYKIVIE